jgi:hypothetical protein
MLGGGFRTTGFSVGNSIASSLTTFADGFYTYIGCSSLASSSTDVFLGAAFGGTGFFTSGFFFAAAAAAAAFFYDLSYFEGLTVAAASSIFVFFCGMTPSVYFASACSPRRPSKIPKVFNPCSLISLSFSSVRPCTAGSSSA